jgi:hypothetical protein
MLNRTPETRNGSKYGSGNLHWERLKAKTEEDGASDSAPHLLPDECCVGKSGQSGCLLQHVHTYAWAHISETLQGGLNRVMFNDVTYISNLMLCNKYKLTF